MYDLLTVVLGLMTMLTGDLDTMRLWGERASRRRAGGGVTAKDCSRRRAGGGVTATDCFISLLGLLY